MIFPKLIYTFFVAMIPAVEVKGAIPFGMALQLAPWQAYLMALCGSFFVVCFLAFFTHWFYVECKKHGFLKRFIGWIDKIGTKNKDNKETLNNGSAVQKNCADASICYIGNKGREI